MIRQKDADSGTDIRCLIGTLSAGENELDACELAIAQQTYTNRSHVRFDGLSEYEAHRRLYSEFMDRSEEFELFLKIDADMVLWNREALARIVDFMRRRPVVDHASFAVHDYLTDSALLGLHAFTNRAVWRVPDDHYRPDVDPEIPGKRLSVRFAPAPVAYHACSPHEYQAFHFGAHRAVKARAASDRRARMEQLLVLRSLVRHASRNPDRRLRLAQLGAWHVWNGDIGSDAHNAGSESKWDLFSYYREQSDADLEAAVPAEWRREIMWRGYLHSKGYGARVMLSTVKERIRSAWMAAAP